ncbi:uncharacterized protein LOC115099443 [Rhinatrema bivittatum]|uniref:uncharacterized protein LOC115099443 n=1 Tax=Rhinatrema bivittatum TaxID=194408 RepID=UPI00112974D8|nr:uncharacterized protein LOC115099443 [Rhinatrema bivittatum]
MGAKGEEREAVFFAAPEEEEFPGTSKQEARREQACQQGPEGHVGRRSDEAVRPTDVSGYASRTGTERQKFPRNQECAWVVGHSFVHWAQRRAAKQAYGENLNLDTSKWTIQWFGSWGMRWGQLSSFLQDQKGIRCFPRIMIVHLGGNNIGKSYCRDLNMNMRKDLVGMLNMMPGMKIGWSDIIIRMKNHAEPLWCWGVKKVNRQIGKWLVQRGGFWIRHYSSWELIGGFFRSDGVHLSDIGNDLFNNALQEGLEQQIRYV